MTHTQPTADIETAPVLPAGWMLDETAAGWHIPEIGVWWVVTDEGLRGAYNEPGKDNLSGLPCPVCAADPDRMPDCAECSGRGSVDHVPYCPRPWDEVIPGLWLGGIHCQYGGVAAGPAEERFREDGNCFPEDVFDAVYSMLHAPDYDPSPGVEYHEYRFADAALEPVHHAHLDQLAASVVADVTAGKTVLVRCQAGMNRSGLVVGLALLKLGWDVEDAVRHLRTIRSPYVLFNTSFVAHLHRIHDQLHR